MTHILAKHTLFESQEIGDDELAEISLILQMRRNFSMSVYKDKCMKRRIAIRMRSNCCRDAAAYCSLLRGSETELDLLQRALTIHVSQFFRNPHMFEKLRSHIIPSLYLKSQESGRRLRVWSLGCAGGEEAYSMAILLREHFAREERQTPTTIDASDIDSEILQAARKAQYNEDRLKDMPAAVRERYFQPQGSLMQLSSGIREMVTFYLNDMTVTSDYLPHDLVLCRNTLIYFTRPEQEKILNGIADILPAGGILVLGKSETLVGDVRRRFSSLCPVERIYQRS